MVEKMKSALVLACDDNFVAYTSCVARRIVTQATQKFPIFVLADGVSEENKLKALGMCPEIEFLDVAELFHARPFPVHSHFTRAAYSRLLLPELLSGFDQALYVDSDVAVLGDLAPLVFMKLRAAPVAAAHDLSMYGSHRELAGRPITPGRPYFNSGVAIYDLKAVESEGIFARAQQFSFDHADRCAYVDQDALNHVLDGRWQVLDWRWNATTFMVDRLPDRPIVRHLTGKSKPWTTDKGNIEPAIVSMWRDDLSNSPWPHLFVDGHSARVKKRWLKTKLYEMLPGMKGRLARFKRDIAQSFQEIERTVGQLATPLL